MHILSENHCHSSQTIGKPFQKSSPTSFSYLSEYLFSEFRFSFAFFQFYKTSCFLHFSSKIINQQELHWISTSFCDTTDMIKSSNLREICLMS